LLRTQHCIFSANAPAKRIPQINEVSDDDDLVFLWSDVLRWQTLTEAALDARDSRFDKRAQAVAVFVAERTDTLFVDVANDMEKRTPRDCGIHALHVQSSFARSDPASANSH
jgi:hypothetical protein